MQEMIDGFINLEDAYYFISFEAIAFLAEALVLLWIGKKINDLTTRYSVDHELTKADNKALAISYTGYLVAQAIIVYGVMLGPSADLVTDLIGVGVWSLVGIILLNLSRVINDKLILRKFSNQKEIIEDRNAGVGAVQAGGYIGTAMLVQAIVSGDQPDWVASVTGVVVFFIIGQISFILFSLIYAKVMRYDLHDEMERDNVAAGISFGLTLVAVGVILSNSVSRSMSIPAFFAWFLNGMVLILLTRLLIDKLILPGHKLDDEIVKDRNWGVALVEGGSAVMVAYLLNASFA